VPGATSVSRSALGVAPRDGVRCGLGGGAGAPLRPVEICQDLSYRPTAGNNHVISEKAQVAALTPAGRPGNPLKCVTGKVT
jgi:hypothetical protein